MEDYVELYKQSVQQMKNGDYLKAIDGLTASYGFNPAFRRSLLQRAICYRLTDQPNKALRDLDHLLTQSPNDNLVYFEKGLNECQLKNYDLAIKSMNYAVGHQPEILTAYLDADALKYNPNGKLMFKRSLLNDVNQLIKKHNDNIALHLIRGLYYCEYDQDLVGLSDFRWVLNVEDNQPIAYKMIDWIHLNDHHTNFYDAVIFNNSIFSTNPYYQGSSKETFHINSVDNLVGLKDVKKQIHEYLSTWRINQELQRRGMALNPVIPTMLFTGDKGTGKTTVAKVLSHQLYQMGIVGADHFVIVTPNNLVSAYPGQSSERTKYVLDHVRNGVLMIKDIDQLANYQENNVGYEVMEQLLNYSHLLLHQHPIIIILSGDEHKITDFINQASSTFKNRFTSHWIHFSHYHQDELFVLLNRLMKQKRHCFDNTSTHDYLKNQFKRYLLDHDQNGSINSQLIKKMVVNLIHQQNLRLVKNNLSQLSDRDFQTITKSDVQNTLNQFQISSTDDPSSTHKTASAELRDMIGLTAVKSQIKKYVANALVNRRLGKNKADLTNMNMVFAGRAGTGKTTVARLFSKIMYEYGILKTDHCKEVSARDLVASYVGQTASKTHNLIMSSLGGVLFIDEAYALLPTAGSDFNREAVDQLVKDMEDYKDKLIIILAGYTKPMENFLNEANPGLRSRFTHWIEFPDYSNDEMIQIMDYQLQQQHLHFADEAAHRLLNQSLIDILSVADRKTLGNARFIRQVIANLVENKNLRLVNKLNEPSFNDDELLIINNSDIIKTFNNIKKEYV